MFLEPVPAAGPAVPNDRLAAINALAAAMAAAADEDGVAALAVRAAHVLAGATHAWLWLREPAEVATAPAPPPLHDVEGAPLAGADGVAGVLWAIGAEPCALEAIARQAGHAIEGRRLRAALAAARREAHTDALTGLWNRRHARGVLEREAAVALRLGRPFAALVVDVDRFKGLNDAHGHDAGDRALGHVAATLAAGARESDLVARWGGEEFVVICPGTDADQAEALAERLRRAVAATPAAIAPDHAVPITVSIGVAAWRPCDEGPDPVIARADRALYAAKAAGRDRVCAAPSALIQA